MNCPSCNSQLEPNAQFCGVCGHRQAGQAAQAGRAGQSSPAAASAPRAAPKPVAKPIPKARPKGDEIYLNQVLNNRFKVESKIGEGGFGAVYRGVQLATGRKVALKLLHPEMTKDENLVARFRREGMVLCNLRDAHTITTYDFDQTPDGTLYIAMELLEGKSLHQTFHEQAPLEWKRVFKILTEMCSSLSEAHAQGIVHRDLKPENIYLESRPGNPEFVKILDFGIAKVMRGDSIDPQSPQLTATGQTLGTLEYMSPEQLMGKPLDGRSDVYALGVLAYEMITGRLPFPDAKGPAGLITAQLKQTPQPPSVALPKAALTPAADRVILKCLEKDKANRYADVSALSEALQEVVTQAGMDAQAAQAAGSHRHSAVEMLETRRGELPQMAAPPVPMAAGPAGSGQGGGMGFAATQAAGMSMHGNPGSHPSSPSQWASGGTGPGQAPFSNQGSSPNAVPYGGHPGSAMAPPQQGYGQMHTPAAQMPGHQLQLSTDTAMSSKKWIWWVLGLLALGAAAGAVLAFVVK